MTNEEAKERIQSLYNDWLPVEYDFEVFDTEENKLDREVFALAIEALKAKSEIENSKSEIKNAKTEISMSKSKMTNEEAITILKKEFSECKDTISVYARKRKEAFDMAIKALEQKWIPVSERLPKDNEYIGNVCKYYLIQDEYGDMHVAHLSNVGWIPMDSLKAIGDEVIAWMPLPEPYKESEDAE